MPISPVVALESTNSYRCAVTAHSPLTWIVLSPLIHASGWSGWSCPAGIFTRVSNGWKQLNCSKKTSLGIARAAGTIGLGTDNVIRAELDQQHRFEAFQQDAPYLFDPSAAGLAEYDGALQTLECTRRAAVYGLWGLWSLFGRQLFADMVDVTFAMGRGFYGKLREARDFEPLHEPECNIVMFRYVPDDLRDASGEFLGSFQLRLRRELIQSGEFYIVPANYNGTPALRATIINPLTQNGHLDLLLETIREKGKRLLTCQDREGHHHIRKGSLS